MTRPFVGLLLFAVPLAVARAQDPVAAIPGARALTHDDYDMWKSIPRGGAGRAISRDGRFVAVVVKPQVGDGELVVRSADGAVTYSHPRGAGPRFTADGRWLVFGIEPPYEAKRAFERDKIVRAKKKKGKGKENGDAPEEPKAALGILSLADGKVTVVERVKSFKVPEEGPAFVAYELEKPKPEKKKGGDADDEGPKKEGPEAKGAAKEEPAKSDDESDDEREYRKDGNPLVVRNLQDGSETRIEGVVSYGLTRKTGFLYFACNSKKDDPKVALGMHALELATGNRTTLVAGAADYRGFAVDRKDRRLAFVSNREDRDAKKPTFDLYAWDFEAERAERIVSHRETDGFPNGRQVSSAFSIRFCDDAEALLFGAGKLPEEDPPDLLPDEKVVLDIWHYEDPLLQPMQRRQASRDRDRALACAWRFDTGRMLVIGSPRERVSFLTPDGARALATDGNPYARRISWDGSYADVWVVNTFDGSREQVVTELRGTPSASPTGRYLLFLRDDDWHVVDLVDGQTRNLTADLPVSFVREDWDTPQPARAYGVAGWTKGDHAVVLYDRYDLWRVAPDGSGATCVTDGFGRATQTELRWVDLDPERKDLPADEPLLLAATNLDTIASGYYRDRLDGLEKPRELIMLDKAFSDLGKAEDADRVFFTLSTFAESPDVWTSDAGFSHLLRLTDINPQQDEFRWGRAELVRWHSADGIPLKGFLIKPDGFDPKRKYPLMVYFYEQMSRRMHSYGTPRPQTSPQPAYYVSNGYLWFVPDIVYREGYPGESCLKCVVSGVQHLIDQGFVDEHAIGAAGHSWGGYQTAYLVTRTNIFKAVESGAPVSNMTSAYGGIRWGSGMSRAFQYERTQSRIGGSLWEYPLRYLENSPVFSADKVETPVLMLHNDQDGAVPWYQGIEYFCALRRLGKEAYLFDYVGADHGLRKRQNQMDWTVRMQQYFDHHLKGAPMPDWMRDGVPFIDREKEKLRFLPPRSVTEAAGR